MFFGEHDHAIDDKNRLTLPRRYRDSLLAGVVLSRGLDRNVDVYPLQEWSVTIETRIKELDPLSVEGRDLRRRFFGAGELTKLDAQGRVLLTPRLVDYAKLTKDVVVVGAYDHLEIWDRGAWDEKIRELEGSGSAP